MIYPVEGADPAQSAKSVEKGLRWSVINQTITGVAGTLTVLAYSRLLTPENLGAFGISLLVFNGLFLLIEAPIRDAVVYYREDEQSHGTAAFWLLFGASSVGSILVLVLADGIAAFYHAPATAGLMRLIVIAFFFRALSVVPAAMLLKHLRFAAHEGLSLLTTLFLYASYVALAAFGWGAMSLVIPSVVASVLYCGLAWLVAGFRPGWGVATGAFADIFHFSRNLFGSKLATYIRSSIDNAAVATLGEKALGLYSFGEDQSSFAVLGVGNPIASVALPVLAGLRERMDEFRKIYLDMLRLAATFSTPMQIGVMVLAELGIRVIFGDKWLSAVPVLRAYLAFRLVDALLPVTDSAISALGRPEVRFRVDTIQLPLFIVATFLGLRWWDGVLGVAWLLTGVRLLAGLVYMGVALRVLRLEAIRVFRSLLPSTLAGAGMGAGVYWLQATGQAARLASIAPGMLQAPLILAGLVAAGIAIYFSLLFLLDRSGFKEVFRLAWRILAPNGLRLHWPGRQEKNSAS